MYDDKEVNVLNIKEWIKKVEKEIIDISSNKPNDRLDYNDSIYKCNIAIGASLNGWSEWLENPSIMNKFTQDELSEIHEEFKKIALLFLSYDIKWTKKLSKKFKIKDTEDLTSLLDQYNSDDKDCDNAYIR